MFKEKRFQTRPTEDIIADFAWARKRYRSVPRIFLADANALCLKTDKLMPILTYIEETFPECERVTIYGRASDILRKTEDELRQLREHGLTMVYIGAESRYTDRYYDYGDERFVCKSPDTSCRSAGSYV